MDREGISALINDASITELEPLFGDFIRSNTISPSICFAKVSTFKRRLGITSDILNTIDDLCEAGYPCVLAGGKMIDFVNNLSRAESLNDYDLWCLRRSHLEGLASDEFSSSFYLTEKPYKSHVIEYTHDRTGTEFQIIKRVFSSVDEILHMFDFRTCGLAYDGVNVYWLKGAIKDIKEKKLVVQCIQPKAVTCYRLQKYIRKGYSISNVDFGLAAIGFLEAQLASRTNSTDLRHRAFNDRSFSVQDAATLAQEGYAASPLVGTATAPPRATSGQPWQR